MRVGRVIPSLALSVVASVLPLQVALAVPVGGADGAAPSDPDDVGIQQATIAAAATGAPVEATAERTTTDTVTVNPNGSVTVASSSQAIRARVDGDWKPVDYTLAEVDGLIAPRASDVALSFSAGGSGLVSIAAGGDSLALDWPGDLPRPTLDGPVATYADVLPGVDLLMTAVPGGYTQILRVNSREAGENPALDQIELPVDLSTGSQIVKQAAGGFTVQADAGPVSLVAPAPTMWDSRSVDPSAGESPDEGDRLSTMGLQVSDESLVVTPDASLLASAATVYPVFIDPGTTGSRNEWTMVQKEYPTTEFYNWSDGEGNGQSVGYQNASGVSTKRLIWEFGLGSVPEDAEIVDASFRVTESHSWSCTKSPVNLDRVGLISSSTNWSNQPAQLNSGNLATSNVQVRLGNATGGDCRTDATRILFSTAALAGSVEDALGARAVALRLSAGTETDPVGWKRFLNDASLSITYARHPRQPVATGTDAGSGYSSCGSWYATGTSLPKINARVSDPDGGTLDVRFLIDRWVSGGYQRVGETTVSDTTVTTSESKIVTATVPSSAVKINGSYVDAAYRFIAIATDGYGFQSVASDPCVFRLDSRNPYAKVTATVNDAPFDWEAWLPRSAKVKVTLEPDDGPRLSRGYDDQMDVVGYTMTTDLSQFKDAVGTRTPLDAQGRSTVTLDLGMAGTPGEHWIKFKSIDRAGRTSTEYTQIIRVEGAFERGRYEFDDSPSDGRTLVPTQSDGTLPPLTVSDTGATRVVQGPDSPGDYVLDLDGASGGAAAGSPSVDTSKAFSISTWMRMADEPTSRRAIFSQQSSSGESFSLAVEPTCSTPTTNTPSKACGVFRVSGPGGTFEVRTAVAIEPGTWFVLAGSFREIDAGRHQIDIWLGRPAGTPDDGKLDQRSLIIGATGFAPFAGTDSSLGFSRAGGVPGSFWKGRLEDLRLYRGIFDVQDLNAHLLADPPKS